eukprot:CAMPEP_0175950010 /NCGR_PEP_ID=MMETSP0108-20121206/29370_1 /TAXON_ID=195067 ORGANISM="Goniomonas pacifica, Strain CCMP1869" /NCGR_SAMPLE_ID=MMETSP0108 /ASSEMBLY_ACC=CAM_ASM_000204 /LENGTH=81 /DNA_ID=CAMNT_0017276037 /DNA_START=20 /DNA_END=265 /DNA_ORIENTATION=+
MAFTLGDLYTATLLFINAICVLNEERFLKKFGYGTPEVTFGNAPPSLQSRIMDFFRAVRMVMMIPLIALNALTIVVKLLMG